MNTSVTTILEKKRPPDFMALLHSFEDRNTPASEFFKDRTSVGTILPGLLDFLRSEFFSENRTIPDSIVGVTRTHPLVREGIMAYIQQGIDRIMSSQQTEQYDLIAFYLFLL